MASKDRKTKGQETFDDELGDLLGSPPEESDAGDLFEDAPEETPPDPEEPPPEDVAVDQDQLEPGAEQPPDDEPATPAAVVRSRKERIIRAAGVLFLLLGIATATLTFMPERYRPASFAGASALLPTPLLFVVAGLVLGQFASLRRRTDQARTRMEEFEQALQRTHTTARSTRRNVRRILGTMKAQLERPPASGEELSRVLGFMQKQDEKLVNLNHATKMYGKAFVDLSGKLVEIRKASEDAREMLEKHDERLLPGIESLLAGASAQIATEVTGHLDSRLDGQGGLSKEEVAALLDQNGAALQHKAAENLERELAGVKDLLEQSGAALLQRTAENLERELAGLKDLLDQSGAALLQKTGENLERELAGLKDLLLESRTDLAERIRAAATETTRAAGDEVAGVLLQCESIQKAVASLEVHVDSTLGRQATLSKEDVGHLLDQSGSVVLQKTAAHLEQELAGLRDLVRESREDVAARIRSLASVAPAAAGHAATAQGARTDSAPHAEQAPAGGGPQTETSGAGQEPVAPARQAAAQPHASSKSAVTGAIAKLRKLRGS